VTARTTTANVSSSTSRRTLAPDLSARAADASARASEDIDLGRGLKK
jgi:hypothetical protein